MGDYRDELRREVERHRLPDGTFERVAKRRDRRRRNRQAGTVLVAVAIAAAGSFGLIRALGGTEEPAGLPTVAPSPSASHPSSPGPTPTPSTPPAGGLAPAVSGPIQFVDAEHGWMVDASGAIEGSSDGGRTWTSVYSGPSIVTQIDFVDPQHGWGVTDGGLVRTSDGGASWQEMPAATLASAQFLSPLSGWAVERTAQLPPNLGRIVRTTDGGATWSSVGQPLEASSVCFVDEENGWGAGPHDAGAALFQTNDGGATWSEIPVPIPGGDQGWTATVRCSQGGPWLLVTGGGAAGHTAFVVFRLGDAGPTPVLQEAGTHPMGTGQGVPESVNPQPGPMVAFDGSAAAIVTSCPPCGGDLPSVSFEETSDGGVTWGHPTVAGSNPPAEPLGASFIDREHGWVLLSTPGSGGSSATVLSTTDSGQTWGQP